MIKFLNTLQEAGLPKYAMVLMLICAFATALTIGLMIYMDATHDCHRYENRVVGKAYMPVCVDWRRK